MAEQLISLGCEIARLGRRGNHHLEIFQPEDGSDGVYFPAQRVVVAGEENLRKLADLLAPYRTNAT